MFPLVLRKLFADNTDQIGWYELSTNPAAIDYLRSHPYGIDWPAFCANPAAIDQIESIYKLQFWVEGMMNKFNWMMLSMNPSAINLIKSNLDKINWETLSANPAAIDILKANPDKICWDSFVDLPEAIDMINEHLLETNYNPTLFEMGMLCSNPKMIDYFKQHPEQIDWEYLSYNPDAIDLLKDNLDEIEWTGLSKNPNAIEILEVNPDNIVWNTVWSNPSIFTYDYDTIKKSKVDLHKELVEYLYHPSKIAKHLETNDDVDEYLL